MEEGPEPQEWVEKAAEEHHHGHGHEAAEGRSGMMASAITAAVLAVLASVGSLFSGHAANEAILAEARATDQWSYYQAKSTKGHLNDVAAGIVSVLSAQAEKKAEGTEPAVAHFRGEAKRYDQEKEKIREEAEHLEAESHHEYGKHQRYALGIAAFQVGIVLASVSILVRYRALYLLSLAAGAVGLICLVLGLAH
jgi:Domain of unknown function (DUF4337)